MASEKLTKGKNRTELVIVLHGLRGTPQQMEGLIDAVSAERPDADVLAVPLAFGGPFGFLSFRPAARIAVDVVTRIEAAIAARRADKETPGEYERFILAGYSFGGVIARKIAIIANGEQPAARFEEGLEAFRHPRDWGAKIERIVLLAAMSRGWSPDAARNWVMATKWTLGSWVGEIFALFGLPPTVAGIRQGAPFIVQTRLQWLALTRATPEADRIMVVQLLGGADDLVAPDDSVDFACDVDGCRTNRFVLIEVPFTHHEDAYEMRRPTDGELAKIEGAISEGKLPEICKSEDEDGLRLQARWVLFGRSVSQRVHKLEDVKIDPQYMSDMPALQPYTHLAHVVFVIHGIRDHGFWTQKIARVIKTEAEKENRKKPVHERRHFFSFTGSYGYFAMVPFVLPWVRRWKTEWLMDHYVEMCARYPNADMSYVGHSNGTYLLARALLDYPAAHFARVVLAGSVIRRDYDWARLLLAEPVRVREVLNYVATHDWVVAVFSNAFQPLKYFFDLGSAGHDGFNQFAKDPPRGLREAHFIDGAHSAALAETQWSEIARFIVKGGEAPAEPAADFRLNRRWWMVGLGRLSSLILVLLVGLVVGIGVLLMLTIGWAEGWVRVLPVAACIVYWWAVYLVATRF